MTLLCWDKVYDFASYHNHSVKRADRCEARRQSRRDSLEPLARRAQAASSVLQLLSLSLLFPPVFAQFLSSTLLSLWLSSAQLIHCEPGGLSESTAGAQSQPPPPICPLDSIENDDFFDQLTAAEAQSVSTNRLRSPLLPPAGWPPIGSGQKAQQDRSGARLMMADRRNECRHVAKRDERTGTERASSTSRKWKGHLAFVCKSAVPKWTSSQVWTGL